MSPTIVLKRFSIERKISLSLQSLLLLFIITLSSFAVSAQQSLTGSVIDARDKSALTGATVMLISKSDSTKVTGGATDLDGKFNVKATSGAYTMRISFVGYKNYQRDLQVTNSLDLGVISLNVDETQLKEVEVVSKQVRVEIKGDTTEFNAGAYKVNPDATAEDLLKKMPGVTIDGNTVSVNGEEVKKIMVDGKPFFSDDPSATLRNLPADVLSSIQVYDQQSDQAMFTGFKDGNAEKTINLKTKPGMNKGSFGKVYAGYGTDDKYNAGFTYNRFNGTRRISLLGMSNNINQQNFSISDIMSVMSNSGDTPGPPGGGGGGNRSGNSGPSNFMTSQQGGITNTSVLGLNYVDMWGSKINVSGNYFYNITKNTNNSSILRDYFTQNSLQYDEVSRSSTKNVNHRVNFKFEYQMDSLSKLTITPRFTYQENDKLTTLSGNTQTVLAGIINKLNNSSSKDADQFNFNNDVLFQHKFMKPGRTISLNINTQYSKNDGDGTYYSSNIQEDSVYVETITDQYYTQYGNSITWGGNLSYTEPIGKKGQLMLSYKPSFTSNDNVKEVWNVSSTGEYTLPDTALYNTFDNKYNVQRGGINYNYNLSKGRISLGMDIQQAELTGHQIYPQTYQVERNFFNVLPTASFNISPDKTSNMDITYRTSTRNPSISQLQNSIDLSNALFVRLGNPDLLQTYENSLSLRMMKRVPEKEKHYMLNIRATQNNNYIGNSTEILTSDSVVQDVLISSGSQLIKSVNLDNYYTLSAFGIYGFPVSKIKSNLNFTGGYTLTNTPALINEVRNEALSNRYTLGMFLGSNINENLDFSIGYNGSYTTVNNSLQAQSDNSYFTHNVTLKANYILLSRIVLSTDVNQYNYMGLSSSFNQSFTLWNASAGYKFLPSRALELKVSAYDMLNQNTSIGRTITETYTEDSRTQVLNRYLMLTLTYTFKNFKNADNAPREFTPPKGMPPPGSMPPPGM